MHVVEQLWAAKKCRPIPFARKDIFQAPFLYLGRVLSGKDVVASSRAVHLLLGGDVKDATLDGDVDGQVGIGAVVLGEFRGGEYFGHVVLGMSVGRKRRRSG